MLQACLNGARSRQASALVPRSARELADDFAACVGAGADEAHLHPYAGGTEDVSEPVLSAVVAACREVARPFGISTHGRITSVLGIPADIAGWQRVPDYASVNLHEPAAPEIRRALEAKGVGVEAGVWSVEDVPRLTDGPKPVRILIEVLTPNPDEALREADRILAALDRVNSETPRLLHGEDGSAWPLLRRAQALGLDARIGFEDVLTDEQGRPAVSNAALVAQAAQSI